MKIAVTKEAKEHITVAEMPLVNKMLAVLRKDDTPVEELARTAMRAVEPSYIFEIYRPKVAISRNSRAVNAITEDSRDFDVWIEFLAFNGYAGAYDCGVYLSDVWGLCGEELASKMYISAFTRRGHSRNGKSD